MTGRKEPHPYLVGAADWYYGTTPDANTTGEPQFTANRDLADGYNIPAGQPIIYNENKPILSRRVFKFYNIKSGYTLDTTYTYSHPNVTADNFIARFGVNQVYTSSLPSIDFTDFNADDREDRLDGTGPGYEPDVILMNDPEHYIQSKYRLVLVAAKKPMAFMVNEQLRDQFENIIQYVSLTEPAIWPVDQDTYDHGTTNLYTEGDSTGVSQKATCWSYWPNYDGTATAKDTAAAYDGDIHITLGAAGSGILDASTEYEFAFSVYDKLLGYESNVWDASENND